MINNIFFNSNPFDEIDIEIKLNFNKKYQLCLNKLNYNRFGIVDDCFLVSLIGESKLFHVYLGYKYGSFYAVKVMKRYKFDSKEMLNIRISEFEKEIELKLTFQKQNFTSHLNKVSYVNFNRFIIYEDFCINSTLMYYSNCCLSERLIRTIFIKLVKYLKNINETCSLFNSQLTLNDILFDDQFNFKLIGLREFKHSTSQLAFKTQEVEGQVICLLKMLSKLLFKEDSSLLDCFLNDLSIEKFQFPQKFNFPFPSHFNEDSTIRFEKINKENSSNSSSTNYLNSSNKLIENEEEVNSELKQKLNTNNIESSDLLNTLNTYNYDKIYNYSKQNNLKKNLDSMGQILDKLTEKYYVMSSIRNKNSLKDFFSKMINDKNMDNFEYLDWFKGEQLDSYEFYHELNSCRVIALESSFKQKAELEKNLIQKKLGYFKVIKDTRSNREIDC